jgi:hypothetical protein
VRGTKLAVDGRGISWGMPPRLSSTPLPDDVLAAYGRAMMAVQAYERGLAMLVLASTRKESGRPIKDAADFTRTLARTERRLEHLFQRATPSEMRKLLPDGFDPAVKAELELLIPIRTRLAHRYLVELIATGVGDGDPRPVIAELDAMFEQFTVASHRLVAAQDSVSPAHPTPPRAMPAEMREAVEELAVRMFLGESASSA